MEAKELAWCVFYFSCLSIRKQMEEILEELWDLQPGYKQYHIWASHPRSEVGGKWPPCECGLMSRHEFSTGRASLSRFVLTPRLSWNCLYDRNLTERGLVKKGKQEHMQNRSGGARMHFLPQEAHERRGCSGSDGCYMVSSSIACREVGGGSSSSSWLSNPTMHCSKVFRRKKHSQPSTSVTAEGDWRTWRGNSLPQWQHGVPEGGNTVALVWEKSLRRKGPAGSVCCQLVVMVNPAGVTVCGCRQC